MRLTKGWCHMKYTKIFLVLIFLTIISAVSCGELETSSSATFQTLTYSIVTVSESMQETSYVISSAKEITKTITRNGAEACSVSATISNDDYSELLSLVSDADLISYSEPECAEPLVGSTASLTYVQSDNIENALMLECEPETAIQNIIDKIEAIDTELTSECN